MMLHIQGGQLALSGREMIDLTKSRPSGCGEGQLVPADADLLLQSPASLCVHHPLLLLLLGGSEAAHHLHAPPAGGRGSATVG